ncbi:MAG: class I SAM-dependent methyltransferase [Actinomycetota bacterium]|nr:class I SAM-dependent methyltransferase [Actinomycetota bacterium]MDH4352959.1 class I SAM-dependent methyltransferase [Actinomycetota bacterium]MDH5279288.1 class I SAM-dependent methyltransferase [Actinomycetota bacterium]
MSTGRTSGRRATLARSVALFRAFRVEQTDPGRFYRVLAADSVDQLSAFADLADATVLDVGGGPGFFADAFRDAGARYFSLDADVGEMRAHGLAQEGTVVGSGTRLPFADGAVDVCYSSNVLEHVATPWVMADEMIRVTRPGGTVFVSFTVWLGPWGGHETSPWHWLGGERAARRYESRHGHPPKNRFGESLFAVSVGEALRWARSRRTAELVSAFPRYAPDWARGLVRVPGLREVATWNLALVLRVR